MHAYILVFSNAVYDINYYDDWVLNLAMIYLIVYHIQD